MTKNSDVLYFPNRQTNKTFELYMTLADGRRISIQNEVNTKTEFVVSENVQVTKIALWAPKDKLMTVFFYPFLRVKGTNTNLIPHPYYKDSKWTANDRYVVDSNPTRYKDCNFITFVVYGRYIGAFGKIDSTKPVPSITNPQEGVISYNDSNFVLEPGTYEFGTYENTKDVQYANFY